MDVQIIDGSLCITCGGRVLLRGITCGVRYMGNYHNTLENTVSRWTLSGGSGDMTAAGDGAVMRFRASGDGLDVTTEYTNLAENIPAADTFIVMRAYLASRVERVFGSTLNCANGNRTNEMQSQPETVLLASGQSFECADFAALSCADGENYIAGYTSCTEYFGSVDICSDGTLEARQFAEFHPLPTGGRMKSDRFHITACGEIVRALPDFCSLATDSVTRFDVPTGYCTWYYYAGGITEEIISDSVADMKKYEKELPVKYIQIDDGWENIWGDWDANGRFPSGMKAQADKIRAAGYIPGIWIAPFGASESSQVMREHPEYFIRERGSNVPRRGAWEQYNLDYSVEGARQYLAALCHRLTYEWGFRYIKLDIITSTIGPYSHSDPDFTAAKNLAAGLRVIRESVTPDTFILGCTCPFLPAAGVVDGMRVSGDIFENWVSLRGVFKNVLKRYYYHKRLFINDADCLIIRKAENEDDKCMRRCTRTDDEIRTYISAAAASGGTLMLSDKLRLLSAEQIKMLSCLFPQSREAAVPLDLMEAEVPGVLDCGTKGRIRTVMLINWDNTPKEMSVPCGDCCYYEFWSGESGKVTGGRYSAQVAPHCTRVMFFTDATVPAVIGSDSVIIPDIKQAFDGKILKLSFSKPGETLYVAARGLKADDASAVKITPVRDGLFAVKHCGGATEISLNAV